MNNILCRLEELKNYCSAWGMGGDLEFLEMVRSLRQEIVNKEKDIERLRRMFEDADIPMSDYISQKNRGSGEFE